jgi:Virulence factor BrkB
VSVTDVCAVAIGCTQCGAPRDSRPNPVRARLRSLLLLAFGGAGGIATTVLSALGAAADAYGASPGGSVRALATAAGIALNVTLFTMTFKVLTARRVTLGQIRVGAVATAVTWQALQLAATPLLGHKLKGATAAYGLFALVTGVPRLPPPGAYLRQGDDRSQMSLLARPEPPPKDLRSSGRARALWRRSPPPSRVPGATPWIAKSMSPGSPTKMARSRPGHRFGVRVGVADALQQPR